MIARSALVFALCTLLGGCSAKDIFGWPSDHWKEQDFKPYVSAQMHSIPGAYPAEPWAYPAGTPTREIVDRWRRAGLIDHVTRSGERRWFWTPPSGVPTVVTGPNFYALSPSSQKGLMNTVAQIYGLDAGFMVMDVHTKKVVGTYSAQGLMMY